MNKDIIVIIAAGVLMAGIVLGVVFLGSESPKTQSPSIPDLEPGSDIGIVRYPAVAASFYPGTAGELNQEIYKFLDGAQSPEVLGYVRGLIVPHAGYDFSGPVAAYSYRTLLANLSVKRTSLKTVILVGPCHGQKVEGAAIDGSDAWETPLGQVAVDTGLRDSLAQANPLFKIDSNPHKNEYSLEVQLPFLQAVFSNFKILPVLTNELSLEQAESIAQTLVEHMDQDTVIIASSDMSHYPQYEQANYADQKVNQAILTGSPAELEKTIASLKKENIPGADTFLCGQAAVEVTMATAQKIEAQSIKLLKHANSGDVEAGDKARVVGYGAFSFSSQRKGNELNAYEQQRLLGIARESVESYVGQRKAPAFEEGSPFLNKKQGAFVTLKKHGQLRGCIGRFSPTDIPLYQVVSEMAIAAATQDLRFTPVIPEELPDLEYEISVLSALKKIDDWQEVEIGTHGVQVRKGFKTGVFLPQVATENNWDREQFLSELCTQKVGLESDCFKQQDVELYVFTAQVFGEQE